ncbi:MAG: CHAD domain-containing protein [Kofleriaceae bacterium]
MVTTTMSDDKPAGYSEHDKLGPLGTKSTVLDKPSELRAALLREFHDAVQAARIAVTSIEENAPSAVHSSRKGLRRARAVLAMFSAALPKSERKAVRRGLQEARRALSAVRDHAVAPDTLAGMNLGETDRATAKRVVEIAAEALPAIGEIKQLLAETAARAAAQVEAIEATLPAEVSWKTVAAGIRETFGEARRARSAAKRSKQSFHTWRRRTKELEYQLDFVARHSGARVDAIRNELEAVATALSPAVDLIMVREFIATYSQGVPADAIDSLIAAIDLQLGDLMKTTRKSARDTFAQKPRRFEKRLVKSARRDLTPLEDGDLVQPTHAD